MIRMQIASWQRQLVTVQQYKIIRDGVHNTKEHKN